MSGCVQESRDENHHLALTGIIGSFLPRHYLALIAQFSRHMLKTLSELKRMGFTHFKGPLSHSLWAETLMGPFICQRCQGHIQLAGPDGDNMPAGSSGNT